MDIHGRTNLYRAGASLCCLADQKYRTESGSHRMPASGNPINHYGTESGSDRMPVSSNPKITTGTDSGSDPESGLKVILSITQVILNSLRNRER